MKRTAKALSYTRNSYHLPHQKNHGTDRVLGPSNYILKAFHSAQAAHTHICELGDRRGICHCGCAATSAVSCCGLAAGTGTSHAHHKQGSRKDFTKCYEVIVGMDSISSKVRAAPAPLPERYWFAQLVKSSTE